MPTIPPYFYWVPSQTSSLDVEPRVRAVKFGDGYEQRSRDGINNRPIQMKMKFRNRSQKVANKILTFLDSLDGVDTFRFVPPKPYSYPRRFYCKKYGPDYNEPNVISIDADFIESFEPMDIWGDPTLWDGILINPLVEWSAAPVNATDAGVEGQMAYDDRYLYFCVAANTWKRIPIHVCTEPVGYMESPYTGYSVYTLDRYYICTDAATSQWRQLPLLTTPTEPTEFDLPVIGEFQTNLNYFYIKIAPEIWKRRYICSW